MAKTNYIIVESDIIDGTIYGMHTTTKIEKAIAYLKKRCETEKKVNEILGKDTFVNFYESIDMPTASFARIGDVRYTINTGFIL